MTIDNLDMRCAEAGRTVQAEEKLINSALAVLQHDGVYAFFLYADSSLKEKGKTLLQEVGVDGGPAYDKTNSSLYTNLDDIFLAKDILERMLIYARYHVKAKPENAASLTIQAVAKPEDV